MSSPIVHVSGIRKTYGRTVAVADVSFDTHEGEIFGLIGPNGAGKTTTLECVEGLRRPDSGAISVLGLDPAREKSRLQDASACSSRKPSFRNASRCGRRSISGRPCIGGRS